MIHYFVAQIRIHNPDEYRKYLDKFDDIFSKYKGEILAVDGSPVLLEGKWSYTKSVIIKFNSKQEFDDWYYSNIGSPNGIARTIQTQEVQKCICLYDCVLSEQKGEKYLKLKL